MPLNKNRLTPRALDAGDSAPFSSIFLASSFFCSQAESTPAPAPVTQTVGTPLAQLGLLKRVYEEKTRCYSLHHIFVYYLSIGLRSFPANGFICRYIFIPTCRRLKGCNSYQCK